MTRRVLFEKLCRTESKSFSPTWISFEQIQSYSLSCQERMIFSFSCERSMLQPQDFAAETPGFFDEAPELS